MAVCAAVMSDPATGVQYLILDPSKTDYTTCTYVVQSGSEVGASILNLTAEEGTQISFAIVGLWMAAWAIKSVIQMVKESDYDKNESE